MIFFSKEGENSVQHYIRISNYRPTVLVLAKERVPSRQSFCADLTCTPGHQMAGTTTASCTTWTTGLCQMGKKHSVSRKHQLLKIPLKSEHIMRTNAQVSVWFVLHACRSTILFPSAVTYFLFISSILLLLCGLQFPRKKKKFKGTPFFKFNYFRSPFIVFIFFCYTIKYQDQSKYTSSFP